MKKHLITLIFIFFSFAVVFAGIHESRDMLSLHLVISGDSISLMNIKSYKGSIKQSHSPHQYFIYECFNGSDSLVYTGKIADPRIVNHDYKSPNKPRKMKGGRIKREKASFSLRIPGDIGIENICFYKEHWSKDNKSKKAVRGEFIGEISIGENVK